ncbi:MAG: S8 family serine peptidase [Blastocatellia bacterium]
MNRVKNHLKLSLTLVLIASLVCWLSFANGAAPFDWQGVRADQAPSSKARAQKKQATAGSDKKLKKVPTQAGPEKATNEPVTGKKPSPSGSATKGAKPEQSRESIDRQLDQLMAKARERGAVRIIIGLRTSFQPEGGLQSARAVQAQRAAITQAQDSFLRRLTGYEPASVKRFETIPFLALEISESGLERLRTDPDVVSIQEDVAVPPSLAESTRIVGAPAAWASGFSGAGQTIAILDTGVDKNHSFLAGKVVSEACYSTTDANRDVRSFCPGGVSESTSSGSGVNCPPGINGCDHGTHVAGIAAGRGTNFSGVARDANLIAIQVFSRFDSPTDCGSLPAPCVLTYTSDQVKGLERVLNLRSSHNIAAVNMSLGGGRNTSNCDTTDQVRTAAINNLRSVGIATVIASGNNGYTDALSAPACISSAVSVGSTNDGSLGTVLDNVSSFSNSASFLSILAPGRSINSSVLEGRFGDKSGTSMAAPHVAGAWAVLKSRSPNASVEQVLSALTNTGVAIRDARNGITKPRIRVDAALAALGGGNCVPTISPASQTFSAAGGNGRVTVTLNAGCSWQAASAVNWITITAGASGNGNGAVDYAVQANPGAARTGTLTIAGQTFTVRQDGAGGSDPCNTFTPISIGQEATGTLSNSDCQFSDGSYVDFYRFSGNAGQRIAVSLSSAAFDAFLLLYDANGDEIALDDDGGPGSDARIPAGNGFFTLPASGNYFIAANSFVGGETGSYRLRVIASAGGAPCTPVASITAGQQLNGRLDTTDCQLEDGSYADLYSFSGVAGQQIAIALDSAQFDAYLLLRNPGGVIIEQDDDGGGGLNSRIPALSGFLTLPVSGTYVIFANSLNANETGAYTLRLSASTPNQNPIPTIASLEPNSAIVGGPGFALMVNGSNFVNGSTVIWNGASRSTTFLNSAKLTAAIPATDLVAAGAARVSVLNPAPGGGLSNAASFSITPLSAADLAITQSATPNVVLADSIITYRLVVTNKSAVTAAGVVVTDNLPSGTSFIACSSDNGGACSGSGNNRTVSFPSLAPGVSAIITLVVKANCFAASDAVISNTATVSSSTVDPNPGDNSATATVNVAPPQPVIALEGGRSFFDFGAIPAARETNPNPPSVVFTIENTGCLPLSVNFSVRRTGGEVDSGKISNPDDGVTFPVGIINADGSVTPASSGQVAGGDKRGFRLYFNPSIPAPAGKTSGMFAHQVLPDSINSVLTVTTSGGGALTFPIIARLSSAAKLVNPLAPRLAPLVALAKSGDEFAVEFSAYDANLDIYHATFQFLDSFGRPVGDAPGFDLEQPIRQSGMVKGQCFTLVKRFSGALGRPQVNKVRVTMYDREGNESVLSGEIGKVIGRVVNVSAASFQEAGVASEAITSAFGAGLAASTQAATSSPLPTSLAGARIFVRDSAEIERQAPLFFVAPGQINYQIPKGTTAGPATVTVARDDQAVATGTVQIAMAYPGLFSANANGQGVAAAVALRVKADGSQSYEPVSVFDQAQNKFVPRQISLGAENEQIYLVLFGTGIRYRSSLSNVTARIGSIDVPVTYAGAQGGFVGLDQVNLKLPRSLAGRGEVDIMLIVDGKPSNAVKVNVY